MTVGELDDSALALLEQTRGAYEPTATNRAHVRWRLERRLSEPPVSVRHDQRVRAWRTGLLAAAALSLVGGAAALGWRPATREAPSDTTAAGLPAALLASPAPAANTAFEHPESVEPDAESEVPAVSGGSARSTGGARGAAAARPEGDLSAEVSLIARAQAATNRGQAEQALAALQEYDRQHQSGALLEERSAARIFALCASGRERDARAAAESFQARWPSSPQLARIRSSCAGRATERSKP